jgi:orotate phosphoribosyltransferase
MAPGAGRATVRARLLDLLRTYSYQYDAGGGFRLASGKQSCFYIDCKATTMRGDAADLVGPVVADRLPPEVSAVGGLTMGADPIALATAAYCTRNGRPLSAFSVRKEAKKHGMRKWIEGCGEPGVKVAVLDDVITTGGSTIDAIRKCRQEGLEVVAVIALVDRQEDGGLEAVRREAGPGIPVTAIFTLDEFRSDPSRSRPATG